MAELLLANKADVNAKDKDGATPLFWAAKKGHKDVAELLLANRADVDARNNIDATPLHFAALRGHKDVAEWLLTSEADVDAKESKYGQTPLDLAATGGHKDVAELLRRHHAKLSASRRVENLEPIAATSPNPEGMDDTGKELRWRRGRAIIFVVPALIVLGGIVLVIVKFLTEN